MKFPLEKRVFLPFFFVECCILCVVRVRVLGASTVQVLSMVGVMMLVFQLFIYPIILRRVPIQSIQRWATLVAVPLYMAVPQLVQLQGRQNALVMATTVLIFFINSLDGSVRARD